MAKRSLHSRLLIGAILWMTGLLFAMNVVVTVIIRHRPDLQSRRVLHFSALGVVAVLFLAGGLWLVGRGLAPLYELRRRLARFRAGESAVIEGEYPAEVQPLVDDINALLDDRDRAIARALSTAGDLAHGLKTPLAILTQEAARAEKAGHGELAATILQQVERMTRQVEYHLAHARATATAGGAPGVRCSVAESAAGLARTMRRLHASRGIEIDLDIPPEQSIRGRREDLDEMLGNLIDNACKWARSRVQVHSSRGNAAVVICVDDDGPGIDPALRERVLQRGVRADQAAPGSGLGLAIVRDLASLYGGSIGLEESPQGGLRARLVLPS